MWDESLNSKSERRHDPIYTEQQIREIVARTANENEPVAQLTHSALLLNQEQSGATIYVTEERVALLQKAANWIKREDLDFEIDPAGSARLSSRYSPLSYVAVTGVHTSNPGPHILSPDANYSTYQFAIGCHGTLTIELSQRDILYIIDNGSLTFSAPDENGVQIQMASSPLNGDPLTRITEEGEVGESSDNRTVRQFFDKDYMGSDEALQIGCMYTNNQTPPEYASGKERLQLDIRHLESLEQGNFLMFIVNDGEYGILLRLGLRKG